MFYEKHNSCPTKKGFWVKVSHRRYGGTDLLRFGPATKRDIKEYYKIHGIPDKYSINPKGAISIMEFVSNDSKHYFTSTAFCREDEVFKRKIALQICLGRICKSLQEHNLQYLTDQIDEFKIQGCRDRNLER